MTAEFITKEDLNQFRIALITDFKRILIDQNQQSLRTNEWLRSFEVKKLLKISTGTLQNLRISGRLKPAKIGNIIYYNAKEIENLLSQ